METVLGLLQHVAGVCLEDQPHRRSGLQTQRAAGAWRQVDDELSATIDFGDHRDVLLTQRYDAPRNYVSCAQVTWPRGRHKNVACAHANLHRVPGSHSSQRRLQSYLGACDGACHGSLVGMHGNYCALKDVLKPGQLSY